MAPPSTPTYHESSRANAGDAKAVEASAKLMANLRINFPLFFLRIEISVRLSYRHSSEVASILCPETVAKMSPFERISASNLIMLQAFAIEQQVTDRIQI